MASVSVRHAAAMVTSNMGAKPAERIGSIAREPACWLLTGLVLLFFFRPLFGGETFYFRDLYLHAFADKKFLVESITRGNVPFWNPFILGGEPFFSNIALSSLYPFNLLFLVVPLIDAFNINIVLHVWLCAVGAYFCARIVGLRSVSSLITGVIYALCGGMLSTVNLPGLIFDMPYLPLLWAFWHLFMQERSRAWFLLSVTCGVFQALAWTHEGNEITMLSMLGWTLCYPYANASLWRRIALWLLLIALIVGICAALLVPAVEIIQNSGRQYQLTAEGFAHFSMHPKRALELVFPNFFGSLNAILPRATYWGWKVVGEYPPMMLNIYFGWGTLLLACFGAWLPPVADEKFPRRVRRYCFMLALCFFAGSLGKFLPMFSAIHAHLPFIDFLFHSPEKLIVGMIFPVALLAGYASEWYVHDRPASPSIDRAWRRICWGIALFSGLLAGIFWGSASVAAWWSDHFFARPSDLLAQRGISRSFAQAAGVMLLFALVTHYRALSKHRWQQAVLAGILTLDFLIAGMPINFYAPRDFFTEIPQIVPLIRQEIGDGRLFRADVPANAALKVPSGEMMWLSRWSLEILSGYAGYTYGIPVIFHEDANNLGQKYIVLLTQTIEKLAWERKLPALSAGAVTLILTHEELDMPGIERVAEAPNFSDLRFFLYRNTRAAARVAFVTDARRAATDADALALLSDPSFDPQQCVILSANESVAAQTNSQRPAADANIQIFEHRVNAWRAHVTTAQNGYLVFAEPFYPGWEATVDGQPAPQLRANLAFTAIPLSAGEHVVTRRYAPKRFYYGAVISLGFIALTLALTRKRFGIVR